MSIHRRLPKLKPTAPDHYLNRRRFVQGLGLSIAGSALTAPLLSAATTQALGQITSQHQPELLKPPFKRPDVFPAKRNPKFDPKNLPLTPQRNAALHNNFYEFLPGQGGPVYKYCKDFTVDPWQLEVRGLCARPTTFDLEDLFKFEQEERIYHFRCVETWALNVPWTGFPLRKLLDKVEPKPNAKYLRFFTANKPHQMPGIRNADYYDWPYQEALRMDEAQNELTLLATGIYGQPLLKQHGAPIRLVCPWKYGYKSPKSIVKIELVEHRPATFWNAAIPGEYGFLSNVNPNVPHPRWSQAQEYFLDDHLNRHPTKLFNGYAEFVADLYPDEPRQPLAEAPAKPR